MGLRSALVDRGTIAGRQKTATKVRGETKYVNKESQPFRCRINMNESNQIQGKDIRFIQYTSEFIMIMETKFINGDDIEIKADDKIVIETGIYAGVYEVDGDPMPIRKKKKQILWQVGLDKFDGKIAQ